MSKQGYYSLIQFSEFPDRGEFVNIGVVLFSHAAPRVVVRFSESSRRAERVFGVSLGSRFNVLKDAIEKRIYADLSGEWNREKIERFISLRAGKVRLSPPRSVVVTDPFDAIEHLFGQLVVDVAPRKREPLASSRLKQRFESIGVEELLDKPEPVELPQGVVIKAPYAYQNGSYNLIKAVSLRDNQDHALEVAGRHAIEGKWLHASTRQSAPKRLVIVGDVQGQEPNFIAAVSDVMKEGNVAFYLMDDLERLAADIRQNAAIHGHIHRA
jgi:hypothetical protein